MIAKLVPKSRTVAVELDQPELHLLLEALVTMASSGAHTDQASDTRRKLQGALMRLANRGHGGA